MNIPEPFRTAVPEGTLEMRTAPSMAEARATGDGNQPRIAGLGSPYATRVTLGGSWFSWDEEVMPGAWKNTITKDDADIRSMTNHDPNRLLGRTTAGTLRLAEDKTGLHYDVDINTADTAAMDTYAQVQRGDMTGASVWFRVISETWTEPTDENGLERELRQINEAELFEVGPVAFPAFPTTTAEAAARSFDSMLRAAGVNKGCRRAAITVDLLTDPATAEQHIRELFARNPNLRDATCNVQAATAAVDDPEQTSETAAVPVEDPPPPHLTGPQVRDRFLTVHKDTHRHLTYLHP